MQLCLTIITTHSYFTLLIAIVSINNDSEIDLYQSH